MQAKENGNDGVIIKNINDVGGTHTQYAVFNPEQIKSVNNKGTFDKSNSNIYFQSASNNIVDLTNEFEKTPTIDEVKIYINEIVENGTKFATLSPNWFVDIKKENSNKKQKRITNKILNKGNYKGLNKKETARYNKYLASLEKLLANAEYAGEKEDKQKIIGKYIDNITIEKKNNKFEISNIEFRKNYLEDIIYNHYKFNTPCNVYMYEDEYGIPLKLNHELKTKPVNIEIH